MSIPLIRVDRFEVADLPEPKREGGRVRCGRHVTFEPGDSRMHVAGLGHITGEAAMDLVRELLAGYVLVEQDRVARS